jgi:hypothetical protein
MSVTSERDQMVTEAIENDPVLGHRWVSCQAEGCHEVWYDPPHERPERGSAR